MDWVHPCRDQRSWHRWVGAAHLKFLWLPSQIVCCAFRFVFWALGSQLLFPRRAPGRCERGFAFSPAHQLHNSDINHHFQQYRWLSEAVGIAQHTVLVAFALILGSLMLGLAIAFGLGGQDLARRYLERRLQHHKKEEREDELSPL